MKIYVVGGAINYANFIKNVELTDSLEEADIVLFTGGEDVTPSIYGCRKHKSTSNNPIRDKEEAKIFKSIKSNQICVGCCRGSQFLCVMNGGILVQDVTDHGIWGTHGITNGDITYQITSTHHQMQYPYNLDDTDYDLLYYSEIQRSQHYYGQNIDSYEIAKHGEPEVVLYHKEGLPKCLAIQGHPEMMPESPVAEMLSNLITNLVNEVK